MTQEHPSLELPGTFADPVIAIAVSNQTQRLSLWMVCLDGESPSKRLVHANVLPSRAAGRDAKWSSFEVRRFNKSWRLIRFTIDLDAGTCSSVLRNISDGRPLYAALEKHSIAPKELEGSSLGSLPLTRLPNAYFSGTTQLHDLPRHLGARRSPVNGAGCYCARFAPSDRFAFLPTRLEDSEALLRKLCNELRTETGLEFDSSAGDAFGSLEVFHFPSLDHSEKPRVEVRYAETPSRAIAISVQSDEDSAEFAVQVRSEQVRDIASDELHLVDRATRKLTLELPDPLDGVAIRVWKRPASSGQWLLWHEQEDHFLRSVGARMQLGGLSGSVGARWLDRLPKRLSSRVERFKQIRQVSMDSPMEISSRKDWETGILNARKLTAGTVPAKSAARFFQRGWGTDENKVQFAEWLKQELSGHAGAIVVVDPYFDLLGLDLICRASGVASELTILTCTQVRSEEDEETVSRADRLQRAAEDIFSVVRGLNLRICDLKSAKSGKSGKQLFHDRYMLFLGASGNAEKGYNLSTSLQSAATINPILITEISRGVLDEVVDYVFGLMKTSDEQLLKTIFPVDANPRSQHPLGLAETRAEAVIAALEAAGRETGAGSALDRLSELGLYKDAKVFCEFTDDELANLTSHLRTASLPSSATVWEGMVEAAMSGWRDGVPEVIERLLTSHTSGDLAGFLQRYLTAHGTGELRTARSYEHTRTLAAALEQPFERSIGEAARFYDRHHDVPLGTMWAIRFALICVIARGPDGLDALVAELRTRKRDAEKVFEAFGGPKKLRPPKDEAERASRVLNNVDALLSAVVATLTWFVQPFGPGLPDTFAHANEHFARALWAIGLIRKTVCDASSLDPTAFLGKLATLSESEQRLCLAQIVFEFRVRQNQAQARSQSRGPLPEWLRNAIVGCAAKPSTVEELVRLTNFYSGPLLPNWARSTHDELLRPLADVGKIDLPSIFRVWDEILTVRRQDEHSNREDFSLVQVWGIAVRELPDTERRNILVSDSSILDRAERILREPLIAHRDYKRWTQCLNEVLWVLLRSWAIGGVCQKDQTGEEALALARRAVALAEDERLVVNAIGEMKYMAEQVIQDLQRPRQLEATLGADVES